MSKATSLTIDHMPSVENLPLEVWHLFQPRRFLIGKIEYELSGLTESFGIYEGWEHHNIQVDAHRITLKGTPTKARSVYVDFTDLPDSVQNFLRGPEGMQEHLDAISGSGEPTGWAWQFEKDENAIVG